MSRTSYKHSCLSITAGELCGLQRGAVPTECSSMDSESKLEQYLLLSKGARGPALAKLIESVTAEAGIFSFGALLDVPSVREVRSCSACAPHQSAQAGRLDVGK